MKNILSPFGIKKAGAIFKLIRFPNTFTAVADSLAGYFLVTDLQCGYFIKPFLFAIVSFSLYSAGIVLNDLLDYKKDLISHPYRPLPSGQISIFGAKFLASAFFGIGFISALLLSWKTFCLAIVLAVSIFLYDKVFKGNLVLSVFFMGLCRFLNFSLGLSLSALSDVISDGLWFFPVALFVYVIILTVISRLEEKITVKSAMLTVFCWVLVSYIIIIGSGLNNTYSGIIYLFFFIVVLLYHLKLQDMDKFIKWLIIGIIFYDASFVGFYKGIAHSLIIALLIVPCIFYSRIIKMT